VQCTTVLASRSLSDDGKSDGQKNSGINMPVFAV
jgi:hypothetical protein